MEESRVKNTKRNMIFSLIYTVVNMLFQFVSRSVIIINLGEQYLGLSSLFSSVLQVLSMAELGFTGAIVYNMYKPLAENDVDAVCALLAYYKKVYRAIGMIILTLGVAVMPFIPHLINGTYPDGANLYLLFGLYLLNTACSYFLFAYKASLLQAVQRMDLINLAYTIVNVTQYLLQIFVVSVFKNYYLFLVVLLAGSGARNIAAAMAAKKYFPEYGCRGVISGETKASIVSRVKGLMVCNVSGITYTTLDSIILSVYIGLSSVAVYNNYITIMNGVSAFIGLVRGAMQASVGNSVARESVEKNYSDMLLWQFMFAIITSLCASCMMGLYQPFMKMWMGKDMLLPIRDVSLICVWFIVDSIQHSYYLYLSGNGLWWELRWPYIFSAVWNLFLNIVLGKYFGITGIIFSSLFSSFASGLIWQCVIIFREYFHRSPAHFFKCQFVYILVSLVVATASYAVCSRVVIGGILGLACRFFISGVLSVSLLTAAYFRTQTYKQAVVFVKRVIRI